MAQPSLAVVCVCTFFTRPFSKNRKMNLHVTSGDATAHKGGLTMEKRFDHNMTLSDLKERLFLLTGIAAADQVVSLYESNDEHAACLGELRAEGASLESQGVARGGMRLHVRDQSGNSRAFEVTEDSAPKYVMPDDVYDARTGTYRAYKKALAAFAPAPVEKTVADYPHIQVGNRCLVEAGHRGEVAYFGAIAGKSGLFVGVRLDDPFGLNDGSVGNERLFEAMPKCGVFVRPEKIQIGDFPKQDSNDEI